MSSRGEGAGVREAAESGELGSDMTLPFHHIEFWSRTHARAFLDSPIGPAWDHLPEVYCGSKKIKRNFQKVLDEWRISVIIHIAVTRERLSETA